MIGIPGSLIWSKTLMELIFNSCGEFRWSPEGPVSQIHSPHLSAGVPGIFTDLLKSVQMLKREWGTESNGKLPHLFIPSITATLVTEWKICVLQWKTCPWAEQVVVVDDDDDISNYKVFLVFIITLCVFPYSRSGQISSVRFFRGFSSPVRQMSGSFRPPRSPNIIWPSWSSILIHYGRQWPELLTRPKTWNIHTYMLVHIAMNVLIRFNNTQVSVL